MGHATHDVLQEIILKVYPDALIEVPVREDKLRILGHCDAKISAEVGIEMKSISTKALSKMRSAKLDHRKQGTIYGKILLLTRMIYLYYSKNDGQVKAMHTEISNVLWNELKDRATRLIEAEELPDKVTKDYLCRDCPYMWKCRPDLITEPVRLLLN